MTFWIHITAGQGPTECHQAVAHALERVQSQATQAGHTLTLLETTPGDARGTLRSALLSAPDEAEDFARSWEGTICWRCRSPFRPQHKRRNWFISVQLMRAPRELLWSTRELRVEAFRSSGPGGQHANTTSSAVRITHPPTGCVAVAQEERSQRLNKQLAMARLAEQIARLNEDRAGLAHRQRWRDHHALERGDPARTFRGPRFRSS